MKITLSAQIHVDRSPTEVFDLAADCSNWPRTIKRVAIIPGVVSAAMENGAEPAPGARRRLAMSDGSTVEEEILAYDRGTEHRYRWANPPAPPLSALIRSGDARWLFDRSGHGTKVSWTYDLGLTSPLAYPLAAVVAFFFKRWMEQNLEHLKAALTQ